ncbi:MAG: hypothetical protein NTW44_03035 [Nitrospirae bacterium]|nr:hypothetical protein [Nitrospirota bacterium]
MATLEQEQNEKNALLSHLAALDEIKPQDIIRTDELGRELSFEIGLPIFERVLKLFHALYTSNLDNVPYNTLNALKNQAKDALDEFNKVKTFSPRQQSQNPIGIRDNLVNSLRDRYDTYFQIISPVIAYSIRKGTDFEALEKKAQETVNSIESLKNEYLSKQGQITSEMESVLQKVRQAAAEVGVAQHATHFKDEAIDHNEKSEKWLYATVAIATLTIVWGFLAIFVIKVPDNASSAQVLQFTIGKLIVLSALYYSLVWSAKNYYAHRHNYVINKHRQNCLNTFETFVKAAGNDAETKNAVLLQATQSIFSSQSSGYVHKDSESESPNKFIEIMRSVKVPGQKT